MKIEKVNPKIKYLYHYTHKQNVDKILKDKAIISKDQYVFFTKSLEDSITAFEREMMVENKLYIDVNGVLRKREKCNKEDYCILKIPYKADNEFYKFKFENQSKESIYSISISHKGAYYFDKAQIINFPQKRKNSMLKKTAIVAIATGLLLFPYSNNAYAASWLDPNNYDISWYQDQTAEEYEIKNAKELAGFAYLVNRENQTFEGKKVTIKADIDLTENSWETIKDIFNGTICGGHRIVLNCLDGALMSNINYDMLDYAYKLKVWKDERYNIQTLNISRPYTVEILKAKLNESKVITVFLNNEKLEDSDDLRTLIKNENDILEVFIGRYMLLENAEGLKIPFQFESGTVIDTIKEAYSEKTNIPVKKLIVKHKGKNLEDGRTIADYNIMTDETLQIYTNVNISTSVEEGKGTIESSESSAVSGDEVTITLNPESDYELDEITVNGESFKSKVEDNKLKITCKDEDIDVKVKYKLKKQIEENPNGQEEVEKEPSNQDEEKEQKDQELKNESNSQEETNNPSTGDNLLVYVITAITATAGIIISKFRKRK